MAQYTLFFPTIVKNEGYYSNVKGDTGGETFIGVSRNNFPHWPGWEIVDSYREDPNFPRVLRSDESLIAAVKTFYKPTFWDAIQGDNIVNQSIAEFLADWGINSGNSVPVKHAQQILGIPADGKVGPQTVAAINAAAGLEFFSKLQAARHQFYLDVVAAHPSDQQFLSNWLERNGSFLYSA